MVIARSAGVVRLPGALPDGAGRQPLPVRALLPARTTGCECPPVGDPPLPGPAVRTAARPGRPAGRGRAGHPRRAAGRGAPGRVHRDGRRPGAGGPGAGRGAARGHPVARPTARCRAASCAPAGTRPPGAHGRGRAGPGAGAAHRPRPRPGAAGRLDRRRPRRATTGPTRRTSPWPCSCAPGCRAGCRWPVGRRDAAADEPSGGSGAGGRGAARPGRLDPGRRAGRRAGGRWLRELGAADWWPGGSPGRGAALPGVDRDAVGGLSRCGPARAEPERDLRRRARAGAGSCAPATRSGPASSTTSGTPGPSGCGCAGGPSLRMWALRSVAVVGARACTRRTARTWRRRSAPGSPSAAGWWSPAAPTGSTAPRTAGRSARAGPPSPCSPAGSTGPTRAGTPS